jgi:carbon-monoxide dehydrogenase iron sulfur subunit
MERPFVEIHFRKRKALAVDATVCSGCRICEVICSVIHEGTVDLERSRIYVKSNPFEGSFNPIVCRQCPDAPCLKACPESAIVINEKDGTVMIVDEECSGCRLCEEACPFAAIRFDQERHKAFKCDFCQGNPECVKWCPTSALGIIEFGGEYPP